MDSDTIKILLIDDDQGDFEMTRVMLSETRGGQFSVEWVSTFEEALDAFRSRAHDVYLVDYFLEDRTGLDLLREARKEGVTAPLIMLTGRGDAQVNRSAISAGAADYLVKGETSPEALGHSILRAVERARIPSASSDPQRGFPGVFRQASTLVGVMRPDGTLMDVNPAFSRFFGVPADEGANYLDLLQEEERPAVSRELETLATGVQTTLSAERRFSTRDHGILWARASLSLIRSAEEGGDHILVLLDKGIESTRQS